jgi:hypothetical protein
MFSGHEPGSIRRNKVSFEYHSSNALSGKIPEVLFHVEIPEYSIHLFKKLNEYRNVDYTGRIVDPHTKRQTKLKLIPQSRFQQLFY